MVELEPALREAEEAQFVRLLAEEPPAYRFKHALFQDAAYSSLTRRERKRLHEVTAHILEAETGDDPDSQSAELARHYEEAGVHAKAIAYLMRYGERATQISAYPEAIQSFERALALVGEDAPVERADVFSHLGDVYCRRSEFSMAQEKFSAALELARHAHAAGAAATALTGLSRIATQQGAHHRARELCERAVQAAREANDTAATARALRQLGIACNNEGENDLAIAHFSAGLELFRQLDDRDGIGSCLNSLGVVAREQGNLDLAWEYFQEALAISQERGDRFSAATRFINMGVVLEQRGDFEGAARYQQQALEIAQEIGDREGVALISLNLGTLALSRGDTDAAQELYRHALYESMALGSVALALYVVGAIAKMQVALGDLDGGATLLGLAFEHPAGTADIKLDFDSVLAELTSKLSADELEAAMQRGKKLRLNEVWGQVMAFRKSSRSKQ